MAKLSPSENFQLYGTYVAYNIMGIHASSPYKTLYYGSGHIMEVVTLTL